jgi:hypothetical protein
MEVDQELELVLEQIVQMKNKDINSLPRVQMPIQVGIDSTHKPLKQQCRRPPR